MMPVRLALLLCCAALLGSCSDTTVIHDSIPPHAAGFAYAESNQSATATATQIEQALQAAGPISIVADVDHAANASNAGFDLRSTRVLLFGNPQLGTPIMQANQQAGIDLPQKILIYENRLGDVYAAYNTTDYLARRHDVGDVATLNQIASALAGFVESATGGIIEERSAGSIDAEEGLVVTESAFDVATTYQNLKDAIDALPPVSIIAELDHAANASSAGLELRPTRLIIFGNPNLGTPLMQAEQSIGIDLPQKILVYEDADGDVFVVYNDPVYLARRHGIATDTEQLGQIATALGNLTAAATQQGQ